MKLKYISTLYETLGKNQLGSYFFYLILILKMTLNFNKKLR